MNSGYMERAEKVLATTYKRQPLVLTRGKGCRLWDSQDRSYLDFVAGIAVCNLGHGHPDIARALATQAEKLCHVSNLYYTVPQMELAERLTRVSFADRAFFCNSGAEANEAAIKLARKYFSAKNQGARHRIISMERSFHGRTMATLSATGQDKIQKGFEPLLDGFDFVPFGDADALRRQIGPETCAVMLEPVQGEGGVRCPPEGYLAEVRHICDDEGLLLIYDEIQTGIGRTGKLFAYEHSGAVPDIMTLAKALGNGLPIGAMLVTESVAAVFGPGSHATTFGGTPVITAAALEVMRLLIDKGIVAHGAEVGNYFRGRLEDLARRHPDVVEDVRGIGLLLGLKLSTPGDPVVAACMERGFLINCIQDRILRFVPPLVVETPEIDALIDCLDEVLPLLKDA
ncbi:N-acetylornithine aminotransferase (EC [Olavius algarvensis associated proteobacterium Delta 3]|nr:N-acetylornithine aminotransferase (EC [Olavius algarvensis associated proteobacterium Delta 3]